MNEKAHVGDPEVLRRRVLLLLVAGWALRPAPPARASLERLLRTSVTSRRHVKAAPEGRKL